MVPSHTNSCVRRPGLSRGLKIILPRPVIDASISSPANSAASGHTALAAAAAIFVISVPGYCALSSLPRYSIRPFARASSVIADKWHRPTDMAVFLVTGLALLTLAFTRGTGMDMPGRAEQLCPVSDMCNGYECSGGHDACLRSIHGMALIVGIISLQPITAQINVTAQYCDLTDVR